MEFLFLLGVIDCVRVTDSIFCWLLFATTTFVAVSRDQNNSSSIINSASGPLFVFITSRVKA